MNKIFSIASALILLSAAGSNAQPGPVLLKDINTKNAVQGLYNMDPANFCTIGGATYFSGYTPNFGRQLWRTDGTGAGTYPITHNPGLNWATGDALASSTEISSSLTAMNGDLYFFTVNKGANSGLNTYNLMKSDIYGTTTTLATSNNNTGLQSILTTNNTVRDGNRKKMVVLNNNLYFAFSDRQNGLELWKSDGTAAGTGLLKDITAGATHSSPYNFAIAGNYVFFTTAGSNNRQDLWRTDGTATGTIKLKDSIANIGTLCMTAINNKLYFIGFYGSANKLWQSDGTIAGTSAIASGYTFGNISPSAMKQGNNLIYYISRDSLMKYDGTTSTLLGTATPFSRLTLQNSWTDVNGTLFFSARRAFSFNGRVGLWKTDGTAAGTVLMKEPFDTYNYKDVNGTLYFAGNDSAGNGMELWKSDGTSAGTVRISDFNTNTGSAIPNDGIIDLNTDYTMTMLNGKLLLTAYNGVSNATGNASILAVSDGTAAGTGFVTPTFTANYDSYVGAKYIWNNQLYFSAYDYQHGYELWKTDGTPAGTTFIADLHPGVQSSYVQGFMPYNNKLYFCTTDTSGGIVRSALWSTDGTTAGTVKVKDSLGNSVYGISKTDTANGKLVFITEGAAYVSDGTSAGTVNIPLLVPGAPQQSAAMNFSLLNGHMIAIAINQTSGLDQLWNVDPAAQTASLFAEGAMSYEEMVTFDNAVYLSRRKTTGQYDYCLWKTDGTLAGTTVVDVAYKPQHLQVSGGELYFTAESTAGSPGYIRKVTAGASGSVNLKTLNGTALPLYTYNSGYQYYRFGEPNQPARFLDNLYPTYPYFIRPKSSLPLLMPAGDTVTGVELMQTDGTSAGTTLVKDILNGKDLSNIQYLTHMLNKQGDSIIVFVANDGVNGNELWVSDGTAAGTKSLVQTMPGKNSMDPKELVWLNNKLIFWGSTQETGSEPYAYELNQVLSTGNIVRNENNALALYPNPANSVVNVIATTEAQLVLYNTVGAKLYEARISSGITAIPVGNLAPGLYHVQVTDSKGKRCSGKFLKK